MTRLCIAVDLDKCIGCYGCEVGCKNKNEIDLGVRWNRLVQVGPIGEFPKLQQYFLPMMCQQCENPSCVEVCPTGASQRDENGVVIIDQELCIGCQSCMTACPYGVRSLNERLNVVEKCTLCQDLDEPYCVTNCAVHARFYGDLDDPESDVSKLLAAKGDSIHYLHDEGNTPSTFYALSEKYASWIPDDQLVAGSDMYAAGTSSPA